MKNLKMFFKIFFSKALLLFITILLSHGCFAKSIKAKIVRVIDGDTVVVRTVNNQIIKIRLSGIDAPEKKQPHGIMSKNYLTNLINKKIVKINVTKKDRYKRQLGTVFIKNTNINLKLVKSGNAWAYRKYLKKMDKKTEEAFVRAESFAQFKKIGLWKKSTPIPPWVWRKKNN